MQHRIQKSIDGFEIVIAHFPPSKALSVLTRVMNLAGVSVEKAGGMPDSGITDAVLPALGGLLQRLEEDKVKRLVDDLLSSVYLVHAQAQPITLDTCQAFYGKPGLVLKVCTAVMQVQFQDFWQAASERLKQGMAMLAANGLSGKETSPGQSGAAS